MTAPSVLPPPPQPPHDELELLLRIGALDEDELREANARGHAAAFRRGIGVAAHA